MGVVSEFALHEQHGLQDAKTEVEEKLGEPFQILQCMKHAGQTIQKMKFINRGSSGFEPWTKALESAKVLHDFVQLHSRLCDGLKRAQVEVETLRQKPKGPLATCATGDTGSLYDLAVRHTEIADVLFWLFQQQGGERVEKYVQAQYRPQLLDLSHLFKDDSFNTTIREALHGLSACHCWERMVDACSVGSVCYAITAWDRMEVRLCMSMWL